MSLSVCYLCWLLRHIEPSQFIFACSTICNKFARSLMKLKIKTTVTSDLAILLACSVKQSLMCIICSTCFCLVFCMNKRDWNLFLHQVENWVHFYNTPFSSISMMSTSKQDIYVTSQCPEPLVFKSDWLFLCVCECADSISRYCFNQESLAVSSSCTHV